MIKILKILDKNYNILAYLNHIQDDISIREVINGEYTLSFKGNIEELKTVYLYDENNILEIDDDYFRPVKMVDERTSNGMTYISCQAEHISYDLLNTKFADFKYIYKDINTVMLQALQGTGFTYQGSDITLKTDIQYEQETNAKAITIAIANNWKGELKYFQKQISVPKRRGQDRGVHFRLGKNLKSVRRIIDRKKRDEQGNPKISYEVDIIDLREQPDYGELEYFELGDTITVIDELLGIEVKARIVEWEYNPLHKENTRVKLGNILSDIKGSLSGITENRKALQEFKKEVSESSKDWNKIKRITNDLGEVIASEIIGNLNTSKTLISNTTGTVALDSNGLLIHDQPTEANSTWAMRLNSTGFMIANSKLPDGNWHWRTFGTGAGFTADSLVAGIIKGLEIQGVNILGSTITGGTINGVNINGSTMVSGNTNSSVIIGQDGFETKRIINGSEKKIIEISSRDFSFNADQIYGAINFYPGNVSYDTSPYYTIAYIEKRKALLINTYENNHNIDLISKNGSIYIESKNGVTVGGRSGLRVMGDKNSLVFTENYGSRLLYAYEMDKCYFATQGTGELKDGICKIELDPIFLETIETDDYHILLTSKDKFIPLYATDITEKSFTVKSDTIKDGVFFYTLSAIRKGYKNKYLDEVQDESAD
ncbi:MAG: phage tail spike protein [Peptoanaerobacter stomatis]|uniref:phage tail spike protein n=1 Tax=Peptoanaerobacter stomatis TaxID=796937 RepID=UPI003F9FF038